MAIGTIQETVRSHSLPVYIKIAKVYENRYRVGEEYRMKHEGEESSVHNAILISKDKMEYGEVPPLAIALAGGSKLRTEAETVIQKTGGGWNDDTMVYLLSFIREDATMEFVEGDIDICETGSK